MHVARSAQSIESTVNASGAPGPSATAHHCHYATSIDYELQHVHRYYKRKVGAALECAQMGTPPLSVRQPLPRTPTSTKQHALIKRGLKLLVASSFTSAS